MDGELAWVSVYRAMPVLAGVSNISSEASDPSQGPHLPLLPEPLKGKETHSTASTGSLLEMKLPPRNQDVSVERGKLSSYFHLLAGVFSF